MRGLSMNRNVLFGAGLGALLAFGFAVPLNASPG